MEVYFNNHESANSGSRLNFGSRDLPLWITKNLNLHFRFAILLRKNKRNHLLFYVLSFIQFGARKLLWSIVVFKLMFNYEVFSTKLHSNELFGLREFKLYLGSRQKVLVDPCLKFLFMYAGLLIGSSYMLIITLVMEDLSLHDVWDRFFSVW